MVNPFDHETAYYDAWFERHGEIYRAELEAVRAMVPGGVEDGLEVGVGTGRFAYPLGIEVGLDPSLEMLMLAAKRGVVPVAGVGEAMPFTGGSFSLVLMVTSLCFCNDPPRVLSETRRVLRRLGRVVVAIIDRDSPLGACYQKRKQTSPFYRDARFLGSKELLSMLKDAGFSGISACQTLFGNDIASISLDVRDGVGEGGFAVVSGVRG